MIMFNKALHSDAETRARERRRSVKNMNSSAMLRKGVRQRNGACDQRKPHYF